MARSDGAVADPETENVTVDGEQSTTSKRNKGVMVTLPPELLAQVKAKGETDNKPNSRIVAECVAQVFGYDLPPMERARRTAGTTGISASAKNAAIAKLIELAEAGQIELSDDLKSLLNLNKQ